MTVVASCTIGNLAAVRGDLDAAGFGPENFSIPAHGTGPRATHAFLHDWGSNAAFVAALEADARVTVQESEIEQPPDRVQALATSQGLVWPATAPPLPDTGTINPGEFYTFGTGDETQRWVVIQQHDRTTFGGDPRQYPALIRRVRTPGAIGPWRQPIDQFDAYLTKEPFTQAGEQVTHKSRLWLCTSGSAGGPDGSLINTFEPGVFGWTDQGAAPGLQFARPASDVATGLWTATPLWSKIDESENAPDGVKIVSGDNSAPDNADFALSAVADPGSSLGHVMRVRWNKGATGGHVIDSVLQLWQGNPNAGGTLIAGLTVTGITEVEQTSTYFLTEAEADSITDYGALHLRLARQGETGGGPAGRRSLSVEFVELELPV